MNDDINYKELFKVLATLIGFIAVAILLFAGIATVLEYMWPTPQSCR